ncbi:MAG: hypothetical protein ACW99U_19690 [Candidatus Thorarchaeota archaeon]|jgi:hypothetical protein
MATIKLTNQVIDAIGKGAMQPIIDKDLPAKVAYTVSLAIEAIRGHVKALEDTRQALLKKYAELDKEGNPRAREDGQVEFQKGGLEKFLSEMERLR